MAVPVSSAEPGPIAPLPVGSLASAGEPRWC